MAVLIVSYNGAAYLADCLHSILASPDAPPPKQILVIDNASTDGSADLVGREFPQVTLVRQPDNSGFVGGNNAGLDHVRKHFPQVGLIALLNQDTIVQSGWLAALISCMQQSERIGCVQAKLRLHPETTLLNSAGNRSHYLGFGFVSGYRQADQGQFDQTRELAFCSGAAMLIRLRALERPWIFDPQYFAYLEDAELGWWMRIRGWSNVFCPQSVVYHRYQFSRNPQMYFRLEANRWRLLLCYYRWSTLLLLLPAIAMMECGLIVYFLRAGAMKQKLRSWGILGNWRSLAESRRMIQGARRISDRELTSLFIWKADFAEVAGLLLNWVGNPLLGLHWRLTKSLLR